MLRSKSRQNAAGSSADADMRADVRVKLIVRPRIRRERDVDAVEFPVDGGRNPVFVVRLGALGSELRVERVEPERARRKGHTANDRRI